MSMEKIVYKDEAKVPITRELRDQFLCPICRDVIENAHRVYPCLRKYVGIDHAVIVPVPVPVPVTILTNYMTIQCQSAVTNL